MLGVIQPPTAFDLSILSKLIFTQEKFENNEEKRLLSDPFRLLKNLDIISSTPSVLSRNF